MTGDDDPYGTAAGFVHWHLDRLPQEGDRFDAHGIRAEVLDIEGHRLRRLRLTLLRDDAASRRLFRERRISDAAPLLPDS